MWNQDLRLPAPPISTPANIWASHLMTDIFAICVFAVLLYGLVTIRQHRGRIVLIMLAGAALTTICEPIVDVLEACYHPELGQSTVFELMGRHMPVWVVVGYTFYFGVLSSVIYLAFEKGVTRPQVFGLFFIPTVIDALQEEFMIRHHLYSYYGNQPLQLTGVYSYSWPPCNGIGEFVGVTAVFLLMPYCKGWQKIAMPLLALPIGDFVGNAAVGLFAFNAVNTQDMPWWLVQLFGFTPWPLALLIVGAIANRVAVKAPVLNVEYGSDAAKLQRA